MLQEERCGFTRLDREVLLNLFSFLSSKGRIGKHHIVAVLLLYVGQVFSERIGMDDIGGFDTMQDHVHDADDIGERFFLFSVEGTLLQDLGIFCGEGFAAFKIVERLAKEARTTYRPIIYFIPNFRCNDFYNRCNERTGCVVFTTITPGITHILYF